MTIRYHTSNVKLILTLFTMAFVLMVDSVHADDATISFRKDIVPIFANSCVKCHSGDDPQGGLNLETEDGFVSGGDSGKAFIAGDPKNSLLLQLVSGQDEDRIMPAQGPRLTEQQIAALSTWIANDAAWESGVVIKGLRQAELKPRRPEVPSGPKQITNPIDRFLLAADSNLTIDSKISDSLFARRVHLDLTGLLPEPQKLEQFLADKSLEKRELLIEQLLASNKEYTEHWITFWNDLLRNAYIGTGYIDGGRKPITDWLYKALYNNMPYNQFVHELLNPKPESEGFIRGIIWRGVVNASQQREMQAAQNVSQVFLGTNLKCASCHDSYINHWKLKDAYGLAAIFADGDLEIHKCNKPIGELANAKFIYPELGSIDATAPRAKRLEQLADLMVSEKNGRLTRTIVNRLWAQFMGRGIVEPVDDMDQEPFNQDLLDWLAVDLADNGYDLKHTMRQIMTSRAYQMSAVGAPKPDDDSYTFAGPIVRRMSAEQFVDAVNSVTRTWPVSPAIKLPNVEMPDGDADHGISLAANWIWDRADAISKDTGGTVYFRKHLNVHEGVLRAAISVTCDNGFILYINGKKIIESDSWNTPIGLDISTHLKPGENIVAIHGYNFPDTVTKKGLQFKGPNAAGLIANISIAYPGEEAETQKWHSFGTDASWLWSRETKANWHTAEFDDSQWSKAAITANANAAPWNISKNLLAKLIAATEGQSHHGLIRTSLVNDDQLTRTLGRPNREQVLTRRSSIATTLQAIELTNGATLDTALKAGAEYWIQQKTESPQDLLEKIYFQALSRVPSKTELEAGLFLLDGEVTDEGIQDILWIITMLPEFQLLY